MDAPPELLTDILGLEHLEVDLVRGRSLNEDLHRVFGGQVAGQALIAAGRTVPTERPVHTVDCIRDGRLREIGDQVPARWLRSRPVEVRYVGDPPWVARESGRPR